MLLVSDIRRQVLSPGREEGRKEGKKEGTSQQVKIFEMLMLDSQQRKNLLLVRRKRRKSSGEGFEGSL